MQINIHEGLLANTAFAQGLACVLLGLVVLTWGLGVRAGLQLEKTTAPDSVQLPTQAKQTSKKILNHLSAQVFSFGEYVPDDVRGAGVERSSLNISVKGILFSADERESQVILELPGHQEKLFRIGDTIPRGAVIKRITPEGVLLLRDGVIESLSLPQDELIFAPVQKPLRHVEP